MPTRFLGSDFQINIDHSGGNGILGNQQYPQVTALSDGRFAVVYQSDFNGNGADLESIAAIFNADGSVTSVPYDDVFNFSSNQSQPVDAALPSGGGFGVVFTNEVHANTAPDTNPTNITYVRVAANGTLGTPLAVGDFDGGLGHDSLKNPAIATLSTGRQVVAFERVYSAGTDDDIFLNVVSADGASTQFAADVGSVLTVSGSGAWEANPSVAAIGNTALVVYEEGAGTTTSSANIAARLFDGATNTLGAAFTIADHAEELFAPKITALDDHRYLIIYSNQGAADDIFGKIFDTTTSTLSAEFEVDQPGGTDQLPAIAATADGGFLVTWTEIVTAGSSFDVVARRYNSDGVAMGQQFVVNQVNSNGVQAYSSVAVSGANVFFDWEEFQSRPSDTSPSSVRGQVMSLTTPPDFNDNGVSDMLWRKSDGTLALWDISSSGAINGSGFLTSGGTQVKPDASWNVVAESDFTGDGRTDLVWRNTAGSTALWTMNGSSITSSAQFSSAGNPVNPDPSWSVAGAGDFNGDARSDILWRNDAGVTAEWLMKGTTILSSVTPSSGGNPVNPDPTWSVQAKPTDFA